MPWCSPHRWRQVPLLPDPGAVPPRLEWWSRPLFLADEGSGGQPAANGVAAVSYQLALSREEMVQNFAAMRRGEIKLVYVSPNGCCSTSSIDWQSCRSACSPSTRPTASPQWGTIFGPEYAALGRLKQWFPRCLWWRSPPPPTRRPAATCCIGWNLQRSLHSHRQFRQAQHPLQPGGEVQGAEQLLRYVQSQKGNCGIVYCSSRNRVEEVAERLSRHGCKGVAPIMPACRWICVCVPRMPSSRTTSR